MLFDKLTTFSDDAAVTATAISDVMDLKAGQATGQQPHIGDNAGTDTYLVILWGTAAVSGGASTVTFSLETSDNADLTSADVLWQSGAIGKASLVPGYQATVLKLPPVDYKRFLGVRYTVGTADLTAGSVTAALVQGPDLPRQYAQNIDVTN